MHLNISGALNILLQEWATEDKMFRTIQEYPIYKDIGFANNSRTLRKKNTQIKDFLHV
jgi:hypothetical protein